MVYIDKSNVRVSNLWLNQNQIVRIAASLVLSLLKSNQRKESGRKSNHWSKWRGYPSLEKLQKCSSQKPKPLLQTDFRLQFAPAPSMSGHRRVSSCWEGLPTPSGSILLNVIPLKLVCQKRNYSLSHLLAAGQPAGQTWHCGSIG